MNHFVTLFDKNYLSRGLLLIESLKNVYKSSFRISVLAMDDDVINYFKTHEDEEILTITLDDMLNAFPELKKIREERTVGEFCWTLSSYSIKYVLDSSYTEMCIYVDSDLYFYNNPQVLFDEMGEKSVLITEHNYYHKYDLSEISGKFCVQFMCFKNNENGRSVLEWWINKCREWCFNRVEDGKFGDQKYLDDWESRFSNIVYNCKNIGCGVAPWNSKKYDLMREDGKVLVRDKISKVISPLFFYHFHGIQRLENNKWILAPYVIEEDFKTLGKSYIKDVLKKEEIIEDNSLKWKILANDPYERKHKLKMAIKAGWMEFNRVLFDKHGYKNNIVDVKNEE